MEPATGSPPGVSAGDDGPLRVLHVDDDPAVLDLAAIQLERQHERIEVTTATSADEGLDVLASGRIDCVVSDYEMPETDGLEFLSAVRERYPEMPFILFTGQGSEDIASEAISAGVTDYLQKEVGTEQYTVLANRVANAVEQAQAREAVEQTRQWYRTLIDRSTDVFSILEADGTIRYQSPAVERRLGYESTEVIRGESAYDFVHPDDVEGVRTAFESVVEDPDRDLASAEYRVVDAEGNWRWFEGVITDRTDTVVGGYVVVSREITERKERERELERYAAVVDALEDAVYALDGDGRYVYVNDSYVEMKHATREELLGTHISEWVSEEIARRKRAEDLLDSDETVGEIEYEFEPASGESFPAQLQYTLVEFPDGERGSAGVIRDVSEARAQRRAVQRERDRFETLFEDFPEPTLAYVYEDGEPYVWAVNAAFEETFGYDEETAVGENVDDLVVQSEKRDEAERIDEHVRKGGFVDRELRRQTVDGIGDFWFRNIRLPEDEELDGFAVYADVTERKERERELERQNQRLEEFTGVVGHDLRNPLEVARSRVEFARRECDSEHLSEAMGALDRMMTLIDDLLTLAHQGTAVDTVESVELGSLAEGCWRTVATADATLSVDLDLTVNGDRSRLKQVFENLFGNAVTHGGDDVHIRVGAIDPTDGDGEDPLGFYVADDGPGIDRGERDRVFEAGYSTTDDGTGFGLNIVRDVVEAHGWEVRVTDSETGGARFEITGVDVA